MKSPGGEFRFEDRPLDALRTLDPHDRVVYVDALSQSLLPVMRIGFVVAPDRLRRALAARAQRLAQAGDRARDPGRFIAEGHLARHVQRMRKIYTGRRAALLRAGAPLRRPASAPSRRRRA